LLFARAAPPAPPAPPVIPVAPALPALEIVPLFVSVPVQKILKPAVLTVFPFATVMSAQKIERVSV
jgi:hypothetical protein